MTTTNNTGELHPKGSTPVPDPTILTTQQLNASIAATRELLETRLDAMDTATRLNKEGMDNFPNMVTEKVDQLHRFLGERFSTVNEKFHSIDKQFSERDTRAEQTSKDSKVAVDAALQAAKEAVGEQNKSNALANAKMEAAFTKQIDQITTLISTTNKALDEKINDLKGRMDRGEGGTAVRHEERGQLNWVIGVVVSGAISLVAIGVAITAIVLK